MKTTTIILLLLSICFLPLTISARPPFIRLPTQADSADYPLVLDKDGFPVRGGAVYLANAYDGAIGVEGGISAANFKYPNLCPYDVFLNLSTPEYPPIIRPIIFHPFKNPIGQVQEFFPTYVEFYKSNPVDPCPVKWNLDHDLIVIFYEPSMFSISPSDDSFPNNTYIFDGIGIVDDNLKRLGTNSTPTYAYQFVNSGLIA